MVNPIIEAGCMVLFGLRRGDQQGAWLGETHKNEYEKSRPACRLTRRGGKHYFQSQLWRPAAVEMGKTNPEQFWLIRLLIVSIQASIANYPFLDSK